MSLLVFPENDPDKIFYKIQQTEKSAKTGAVNDYGVEDPNRDPQAPCYLAVAETCDI
jgi:hypothetical protein